MDAETKWENKELERLSGQIEGCAKAINKIHVEIAVLKVKSGIWGAMGGAIPIAIYFFLEAAKST